VEGDGRWWPDEGRHHEEDNKEEQAKVKDALEMNVIKEMDSFKLETLDGELQKHGDIGVDLIDDELWCGDGQLRGDDGHEWDDDIGWWWYKE
jgi:hypothetical protein